MSLVEQLETVRLAIVEITRTCAQVRGDARDGSRVERTARADVAAAERAADEAERALRAAQRLLETDGRGALDEAADKQRQLGHQSQRMTEMSREARLLADR